MKEIVYKHWTSGGTGVTNFYPFWLPFYQKVTERYGNSDLVAVDRPIEPFPFGDGSLHNLGERFDLSGFWRLFEDMWANEPPIVGEQWLMKSACCDTPYYEVTIRGRVGDYFEVICEDSAIGAGNVFDRDWFIGRRGTYLGSFYVDRDAPEGLFD